MPSQIAYLHYVQLLDSALPIGGFSHSFGLETFVQQGRVDSIEQLEHYLRSLLHHSLAPLDGLAIKGVREAMERRDDALVAHYDRIVHLQRTPRESRDGMHKMGKRLIRLGSPLYPEAELARLEELLRLHGGYGTLPTVHAWISGSLGVSVDEAVTGYLYSGMTTMVNSALRLMAIGQTDGQLLIRRILAEIDRQWALVREQPADALHSFSLAADIRAMQHETLYSRLFMS